MQPETAFKKQNETVWNHKDGLQGCLKKELMKIALVAYIIPGICILGHSAENEILENFVAVNDMTV